MIASLMMYLRPETAAAHDAYWALVRQALAKRGIDAPETMSNDAPAFNVWRAPDLVLSQTCGLPYRMFLSDDVALVGTPDFGIEGCSPGHYRSAVVVRRDDPRSVLSDYASARFAFNEAHSQSGVGAIHSAARAQGFWFNDMIQSGGHARSAEMVAKGAADIAALDAQTWRYISRFDAATDNLRVLMWTEPTPSLPYITSKSMDAKAVFNAVSEAIDALAPETRATLDLQGIVWLPKAAYMALEIPPAPV